MKAKSFVIGMMVVALAASCLSLVSDNMVLNLIFGMVAYLVLPGVMIQLAFRRGLSVRLESLLYGLGLSLAYWLLGGLALNTFLPLLGYDKPLAVFPLSVFYLCSMTLLSVLAVNNNRGEVFDVKLPRMTLADRIVFWAAASLPVFSVFGAWSLNNGGSGSMVMVMLVLVAGLMVFMAAWRGNVSRHIFPFVVFQCALALLLMYSMRSWHVMGWDIHGEYQVLRETLRRHLWEMSSFPGQPYNACLSITILPAILQQLFHIPAEYIYKFVFQIIFAGLPVIVYALARKYLRPRLSFFVPMLFVSQVYFFEQMPALARQEVALVFFGLIILLLVDGQISKKCRLTLAYIFLTCLVLAHYSTAYIWLVVAALAYLFLRIAYVAPQLRNHAKPALTFCMIFVTALLMFLWEGSITNTAGHASGVAANSLRTLSEVFSPSSLKDGVQRAFVSPPSTNTDENIQEAAERAARRRRGPSVDYYETSGQPDVTLVAQGGLSYRASLLPPLASQSLLYLAIIVKDCLLYLMPLVGISVMAGRFLKKPHTKPDFVFIALASLFFTAFVLFFPHLQKNYNLSRLSLQLFMVLAVASIFGFWQIAKKSAKYGLVVVAAAVVLTFTYFTGVLQQLIGGQIRITLASSEQARSPFYMYDAETASAKWLSANKNAATPVYADSIADLRLHSNGELDAYNDLFPAALPKNSYVYLVSYNVGAGGSAYIQNGNATLIFNYPIDFLGHNKNVIYDNGKSKVYR
jgi:uncharacterized membrane protein